MSAGEDKEEGCETLLLAASCLWMWEQQEEGVENHERVEEKCFSWLLLFAFFLDKKIFINEAC